MAVHDNTYSRIVAWAKVLLPVLALVLLSVMFLIARTIDPTEALSYADVDVDALIADPRITRPSFSGVTDDGAAITFTAETARPDPDQQEDFTASGLKARIETPDGGLITIGAASAFLDGSESLLALSGGVLVTTSSDYRIESDRLTSRLDATWVASDGPVTAWAPAGQIKAGRVEISRREAGNQSYLLVFKDGVKLIYEPEPAKER